eukprot:TRINITY_DN7355_c0_g1_i18.p1 TRINITY_DN7355_c0_g1~~TRINITY_DN7355_c0_g1_i18.p1  ORF type:complete len:482 (-),score=107.47 TRINITY_DN7355_c0_g1_i18:37-1482(-)
MNQEHDEKFKSFCVDHAKLICLECHLFDHKNCSVKRIPQVVDEKKAEMNELLKIGSRTMEALLDRQNRLIDRREHLASNEAEAMAQVDAYCEELKTQIKRMTQEQNEASNEESRVVMECVRGLSEIHSQLKNAQKANDPVSLIHQVSLFKQQQQAAIVQGEKLLTSKSSYSFPVLSKRMTDIQSQTKEDIPAESSNKQQLPAVQVKGQFIQKWGSQGSGNGQFKQPIGISVYDGHVYISECGNSRIQVLTKEGGAFVRTWGSRGSEDGQFSNPWGLCVYGGCVYVCDISNNRIQVFSLDGRFLRKWGSAGAGDGQLSAPMDIAIHNDLAYVAEYGNYRVQVFQLDGQFVRKWGSNGTGDGQFSYAAGICVSNNLVFTSDSNNHRVQVFTLSGEFVRKWGSQGDADGQFNVPCGICVSGDFVYVSECRNDRIQVFTVTGEFVHKWGSQGSANDQFLYPRGICDSGGRLYVCDQNNHRVSLFS